MLWVASHIEAEIKWQIYCRQNFQIYSLEKISNFDYNVTSNSASVQVMAWCRTGTKPLPWTNMTQFTDACTRHLVSVSWMMTQPPHSFMIPWIAMNTWRPRQNNRHFLNDYFKWIILYENVWISMKISLNFVSKGPINDIPALVHLMAWRRLGDKPLSEPMMVSLTDAYMCHWASMD